jgi:hypothetical protein
MAAACDSLEKIRRYLRASQHRKNVPSGESDYCFRSSNKWKMLAFLIETSGATFIADLEIVPLDVCWFYQNAQKCRAEVLVCRTPPVPNTISESSSNPWLTKISSVQPEETTKRSPSERYAIGIYLVSLRQVGERQSQKTTPKPPRKARRTTRGLCYQTSSSKGEAARLKMGLLTPTPRSRRPFSHHRLDLFFASSSM